MARNFLGDKIDDKTFASVTSMEILGTRWLMGSWFVCRDKLWVKTEIPLAALLMKYLPSDTGLQIILS